MIEHLKKKYINWRYPIPVISAREICPKHQKVIVDYFPPESGGISGDEALFIAALVQKMQPMRILEIGTFLGRTTRLLVANSGCMVHTLDLGEDKTTKLPASNLALINKNRVGEAVKGSPFIEQHLGDSATYDFKKIGFADLFFIDGSHTYEYVKNDTEKCMAIALKKPKSIFLWHDVGPGCPGVQRYIWKLRKKGYDIKRIKNTSLGYLKL